MSAQVVDGLLGPFADELVWTEQIDPVLALDAIIAGEQDISTIQVRGAAQKQRAVDSPGVQTISSFGLFGGILMNAAEFQPGLSMNPFPDEGIREALQWLINRDTVVQNAYQGFAIPFSGPFHPLSQDWAREQATFEALAAEYSFDFARAQAQIDSRMAALGAVRAGPANTWHDSDGMEIVIIVLARVEDERAAVGSYIASQLQAVGFSVDLQVVPAGTAIPSYISRTPPWVVGTFTPKPG